MGKYIDGAVSLGAIISMVFFGLLWVIATIAGVALPVLLVIALIRFLMA